MKNIKIVPKCAVERVNDESGNVGECVNAMNVRECNDALVTMGNWHELCEIQQDERVMLIDKRRESDYFLSCKGNEVRVLCKRVNGECVEQNEVICELDGGVRWMRSVGDFVVISTDSGVKYLHYANGEYRLLDFMKIAPQMVFGAVNSAEVSETVSSVDFEEPYSSWDKLSDKDSKAIGDSVRYSAEVLHNRAKQNGAFVQPVAVRYAVRLWDDNYAWVSAPVVVGCGVSMREQVSVAIDTDMSSCGESELRATMYNVGVAVVEPLAREWLGLVKSVDVLVSDELSPFEAGKVMCRCDYATPNRYLTYWLPQRERLMAWAELVNPAKWHILTRINDVQGLSEGRVNAVNGVAAVTDSMGALSESCVGLMRSGLFTESITREQAYKLTQEMNRDVVGNTGLCAGGRLYIGGLSLVMRNAWQSVQYWGGNVEAKPCEMIVTARLNTANGEAVKVARYSCDYTPAKLNMLITYPDARAVELTVKVLCDETVSEWTGTLQRCDEQGFAYFLNDNAEDVELKPGVSFYEPAEQRVVELQLNEVEVSSVANPFVIEQRRMVGQSEVLALERVKKSVYSSTFGRYPIYVFTREGIYALSYKAKGDYSDAQLLDYRTVDDKCVVAIGDDKVYFVSNGGVLCELNGKDVTEITTLPDVAQMAWIKSKKELLVRAEDNTLRVMMPGGRWSERNEGLRHLCVSNTLDVAGQTVLGKMVDLNDERQGDVMFLVETHSIEAASGLMTAPLLMTINVSGVFADKGVAKLYGSDGVDCEWRLLGEILLEGRVCHPRQIRIYSRPCRLYKVMIEGVAKGDVVLRNVIVDYKV